MQKKKYINPQLRKVSLANCQALTQRIFETKRRQCAESEMSGHKCWGELHTPTVVRDILAAMTPEEFAGWLARLYPDTIEVLTT